MIPQSKLCINCKQTKDASEFYMKRDGKYTYLKSYCKKCDYEIKLQKTYDLCDCGQQKQKRSKMCKSCKSKKSKCSLLSDFTDRYRDKHGSRSAYALVRARARHITKNNTSCAFCGYFKHVETCHIIPIASFSIDTPIDIINSDDNLICLCRNCHWELDNGLKDRFGNDIIL